MNLSDGRNSTKALFHSTNIDELYGKNFIASKSIGSRSNKRNSRDTQTHRYFHRIVPNNVPVSPSTFLLQSDCIHLFRSLFLDGSGKVRATNIPVLAIKERDDVNNVFRSTLQRQLRGEKGKFFVEKMNRCFRISR